MSPGVQNVILGAPFDPYRLPNNAAAYSLRGSPSDSTYLIDGSNRLMLVADRSGNSGVNGLVLNGAASNYASAPDSPPLSVTGDIDLRVWVALNDWTPTANAMLLDKFGGAGQRAYQLYVLTTGALALELTTDGTAVKSATSSATVSASNYDPTWVRVTRASASGDVTFYTSADGSSWTQLGATQSTTAGGIHDGNAILAIGSNVAASAVISGIIRRAQVYNGIAGTLVFDANFTTQAKLAASFTESSANAATVTVNTSGDFGARICGARDLVQLTQANQAIVSASGGYNLATFDGTNDYMKAAAFSLEQPMSVYFAGSQASWTINKLFWDGGSVDTAGLQTRTATPEVRHQSGGAFGAALGTVAVGARTTLAATYSGASSLLQRNLDVSVAGSTTVAAANGFTLGAAGSATVGWSNITFSEVLVRSVEDNGATTNKIAAYLMRQWGIS